MAKTIGLVIKEEPKKEKPKKVTPKKTKEPEKVEEVVEDKPLQ